MTEGSNNRTRWLNIRLTAAEHSQIMRAVSRTTDRKMSQYARKLLLGKPVKVLTRNKSLDDFMEELVRLKKELNALGNNFNQIVKRINSVHEDVELRFCLGIARQQQTQLIEQIEILNSLILKFSNRWFQNS